MAMSQRELVIGLDSSTTACKAIVWDNSGKALAVGRSSLPMIKPRPSWHEQSAGAWWDAAVEALQAAVTKIDKNRLAAISITVQRETFVVTDENNQPLGNAMLWMDERSRELLPEIDRSYGKDRVHRESGKPLSANLSLGKLFWLRHNRPDLFEKIHHVLDVHAALVHHLTGRFATSMGCADPMGLFDMVKGCWNTALIDIIGAKEQWFPEALPVGAVMGTVTAEAALLTGLPEGLPVIAGLGDGQAAGLAVCAAQEGASYLNLGTAVVTGTYSRDYLIDPAFRTTYGGFDNTFLLETVLLGGTYTITWFIEQFFKPVSGELADNVYPEEILDKEAAQVPPGAMGLTLVPYWNTAMNPYWDASASGIMVGWRGIHGRAHFYRAILEGIAFELRLHTLGIEAAIQRLLDRYMIVGGGSRSDLWCQIIADTTGKPVYRTNVTEASALGAGILAAAGAGLFSSPVDAARAMAPSTMQPFVPEAQRQAFYEKRYTQVYARLYQALREPLARLADLVEEQG